MEKKEKISMVQLKQLFLEANIVNFPKLIDEYKNDERKTVQNLLASMEKKHIKYLEEIDRTNNLKQYENDYKKRGYNFIAGIDEVGRGPLAGPVVAAAVILPDDFDVLYIDDSKKLSREKREYLSDIIMDKCIAYSIGIVEPAIIDKINILEATHVAMKEAIDSLETQPDCILVDALTIKNVKTYQVPIIKGDTKSISIAAASIIAKVYRDNLMDELHEKYPKYDFCNNKGYGAKKHLDALVQYGITSIHRKTFLKNILNDEPAKNNSRKIGNFGEQIAMKLLLNKQYEILKTNFKYDIGEIDIIAKINDCTVFVEVKLRKNTDYGNPCEYVTEDKINRIKKTAEKYLVDNDLLDTDIRFDVIEIIYNEHEKPLFKHTENAF